MPNLVDSAPLAAPGETEAGKEKFQPARGGFAARHLGSAPDQAAAMAVETGYPSVEELIASAVPDAIRSDRPLALPEALSEKEALERLRGIMDRNEVYRSCIGMGYYGCVTPGVIQRNILENPGWYTAYTPYQAEIAQGRLEALLNFQTMVTDLTGLPVANASLLDEGTAAAEAMAMCASARPKGTVFYVSSGCHPQTIDVLRTRAEPLDIELIVSDEKTWELPDEADPTILGAIVQYPDTEGGIHHYTRLAEKVHATGGLFIVATDLLALTLLTPPGEFGADIAVGNSQRFGVPLGFGGPHAAFLACSDALKRRLPGRLVGVSHDVAGKPAYRLALQTREQHIRREKATSNICTAQVLLAVVAAMYATYHGPEGLKRIARSVHGRAARLAAALAEAGYEIGHAHYFDTLKVSVSADQLEAIVDRCEVSRINLRHFDGGFLGVAVDETVDDQALEAIAALFGADLPAEAGEALPAELIRDTSFLTHPVFNRFHTETEMLRYLHRLEARDLTLNTSMIPLGSCTMKLNATAEMQPISWPTVNALHPFAPGSQVTGYATLCSELESWLAEITGFDAVSLQPNAGSQGEYAGLLAIRRYHQARNDSERKVCLIPTSAHGTNPASAVMAGFRVVPVRCDHAGNVDLDDIRAKATEHAAALGALMITYPSTHGVFEESIKDICAIVHGHGGLVYMDGANLNAQVGLCRPAELGADVCHLNLHKTFCIPHGGGGPGVGPIGVVKALEPYLPGHRQWTEHPDGAVCAAPYGSASILVISWMYIAMMGGDGLTEATRIAILNANYIAHRLQPFYPVLYRGSKGLVAHECIIDLRPLKEESGIEVEDVAKRLMDYGFHAPTMSWPVAGTLMIEPTESESREELDRFCEALIRIHGEILQVARGESDATHNVLKGAPHPAEVLLSDGWDRPYSREVAAYPAPWTKEHKYWPPVSRIDNVYGDRNLICTCEGMEAFAEAGS